MQPQVHLGPLTIQTFGICFALGFAACGLLVAALRATGRRVYPINPMAVARYRERHSMSRTKSDHADAMAIALCHHYLQRDLARSLSS